MKKLAMVMITMFLVTGLATSAFAFGPPWDGHGRYNNSRRSVHDGWRNEHRGHDRGWHGGYNGHERGRRVDHRDNGRNDRSHESGAMISLPLVPLPGISHMFPSINFSIH